MCYGVDWFFVQQIEGEVRMNDPKNEKRTEVAAKTAPFCPVAPNGNMVGTRSPSYTGRMATHAAKQNDQGQQSTEHFSGEREDEE